MANACLLDPAIVAAAHSYLHANDGTSAAHDALRRMSGRDRKRTRAAYADESARLQARRELLTVLFASPAPLPQPIADLLLTKEEIRRGKTSDEFQGPKGRKRRTLPFAIGITTEPVRGRRHDFWFASDCRSPARAARRDGYQARLAARREPSPLALAA